MYVCMYDLIILISETLSGIPLIIFLDAPGNICIKSDERSQKPHIEQIRIGDIPWIK